MVELTRIQKSSNVYAVFDLNEIEAPIDHVSLMLINNNQGQPTGFAPITFEEKNGIPSHMLFDVTGRITLREYVSKNITQEDFRQMLIHLMDAIESFDDYMIESSQVLMDMDTIFINTLDHSVSFLCVALLGMHQPENMYLFFKELVESSFVTAGRGEVSYFNHVYNIVHNEKMFSLRNIRLALRGSVSEQPEIEKKEKNQQFLREEKRLEEPDTITIDTNSKTSKEEDVEVVPPPEQDMKKKSLLGGLFSSRKKKDEPHPAADNGYKGGLASLKKGSQPDIQEPVHQMEQVTQPDFDSAGSNSMGGTNLLGEGTEYMPQNPPIQPPPRRPEYSGTIMLKAEPAAAPAHTETMTQGAGKYGATILLMPEERKALLVRKKTQERLSIDKTEFTIGRDIPGLDLDLHENVYIGHRHANIVRRDDEFYLTDQHAVNRTYQNGARLEMGEERKLNDGDTIRLANEEFTFHIL